MAGSDIQNVLDTAMLQCLAVIAAAHDHSIEEELNLAVKAHVLSQFDEYGESQLVERAFSDHSTAAAK